MSYKTKHFLPLLAKFDGNIYFIFIILTITFIILHGGAIKHLDIYSLSSGIFIMPQK